MALVPTALGSEYGIRATAKWQVSSKRTAADTVMRLALELTKVCSMDFLSLTFRD